MLILGIESSCDETGVALVQTGAPGSVRVNKAGCLGRCDDGPVIVVYPDNVWYTYIDKEDIDEIIDSHLVHGRVVQRLRSRHR